MSLDSRKLSVESRSLLKPPLEEISRGMILALFYCFLFEVLCIFQFTIIKSASNLKLSVLAHFNSFINK